MRFAFYLNVPAARKNIFIFNLNFLIFRAQKLSTFHTITLKTEK